MATLNPLHLKREFSDNIALTYTYLKYKKLMHIFQVWLSQEIV